jgi:membrane-associated phospholipid phosphatase
MPRFLSRYFPLFFIVLLASVARGQDSSEAQRHRSNGYIASYWHNGIGLVASPLHWKGEEWAKFGGTTAIAAVLISMDEPVTQPFFSWTVPFGEAFGDVANYLGSPFTQFSISGLAIGAGALAKNQSLKNFGLDNLQAQVFTAGITLVIKELTHRARPEAGEGAYKWYGPFNGQGNESFFSGHTSLSFCTATMAYLYSHKKWWVGVISYTLASGVAVGRMQQQKHWASDVLVGGVVGTAVANFIYNQQQKRRESVVKLKVIP